MAASPDSAALRDATTIAQRIAGDERAADAAREAYRREGLPVLQADGDLSTILEPGELVHAIHPMALLERGSSGTPDEPLRGGTLVVTSRRLVHNGALVLAWPLSAVAEMNVALERLLMLRLADGTDLAVEVAAPRLLRVQLASAKAALRDDARTAAVAVEPQPSLPDAPAR